MRCLGLFFLFINLLLIYNCTKEGVAGPPGEEGTDGSTIYSGTTSPNNDVGLIGDYYYQITTSNFYGPKTADGWGNPTNLKGAVGSDGNPGAPGPTGPSGADGSKIWSGNTEPTTSLGKDGDYYFQTNTGNFYGPKIGNSWGMPVNLKGSVGPKGEDGATIISGAAIPSSNLGKEGDYYFRSLTGDFYGPKTNSGWGIPTNLKGATGATGASGSIIYSGTIPPNNNLGSLNDFYFDKTTAEFYGPKTNSGWGTAVNLKGSVGPKGADGSTIISGAGIPTLAIGAVGDYYFRSLTCDFYGPKTASSWGIPTSLKGANGATGASGATILSGLVRPDTSLGRVGDFYFDKSTADFYGPKQSRNWGTPINLRGPQGPPGTSDVMYSNWETITSSNGQIIIPAPITQAILDKGEVAVYVKEFKGETLLGLYKIPYMSNHLTELVEFRLELNRIMVYSRRGSIPSTDNQYRYVIIPGHIEIGSHQSKVNLSDYKKVMKTYNIPE